MDTDNCFNLLVIHQGVVTVMQPVLPPTVVIEDFDWQNKHLIAPLKHSVLYFEKIGEPGTRPAFLVQSVCCFLLVNQQMYGHT